MTAITAAKFEDMAKALHRANAENESLRVEIADVTLEMDQNDINYGLDKELALRILRLLSALEACGLMADKQIPDYLSEEISEICSMLTSEILK